MACKACGFDHSPMLDCKFAARIRGDSVMPSITSRITRSAIVTPEAETIVTHIKPVTAELHPNVTVFTDLGFDKFHWPKSAAQRSKEYRARKAA